MLLVNHFPQIHAKHPHIKFNTTLPSSSSSSSTATKPSAFIEIKLLGANNKSSQETGSGNNDRVVSLDLNGKASTNLNSAALFSQLTRLISNSNTTVSQ
jgi:hypothetical protein